MKIARLPTGELVEFPPDLPDDEMDRQVRAKLGVAEPPDQGQMLTQLFEAVMQQMRLDKRQQQLARALFAQGKDDSFSLDATLQQLRQTSHRSRHLLQMFLEIQVATALADGNLHAAERTG